MEQTHHPSTDGLVACLWLSNTEAQPRGLACPASCRMDCRGGRRLRVTPRKELGSEGRSQGRSPSSAHPGAGTWETSTDARRATHG